MNTKDSAALRESKTNPEAFSHLYDTYADKVYSYFWYRTGHNKEISEDLMQETFVRAFEKRSTFRIRKYSYLSYLLTIAHNLLVDYYRSSQAIPLESVGEIPSEITTDQESLHKEASGLLWRAIQQLSDAEKGAILHFYQDGRKVKEIARIMNKSENAVKLLLSRARKKLKHHPYLQDMSHYQQPSRAVTPAKYSQ